MASKIKGKSSNLLCLGIVRVGDGFHPLDVKKGFNRLAETLGITGRGGGIRTRDPLHPMQHLLLLITSQELSETRLQPLQIGARND